MEFNFVLKILACIIMSVNCSNRVLSQWMTSLGSFGESDGCSEKALKELGTRARGIQE